MLCSLSQWLLIVTTQSEGCQQRMQILSAAARTEMLICVGWGMGWLNTFKCFMRMQRLWCFVFRSVPWRSYANDWFSPQAVIVDMELEQNVLQCLVLFSAFLSRERWKASEMSEPCGNLCLIPQIPEHLYGLVSCHWVHQLWVSHLKKSNDGHPLLYSQV